MAGLRQYAAVWQIPGGPVLLTIGILARLSIGMTPLALLLLVRQSTGAYTPAAVAGGIFAIAGAALAPLAGRIADRIGPAPVLVVTAVAHPVALAVLVLANHSGSVGLIFTASAAAGATYPPLSAAIRGAWTSLTTPESGRHHLRTSALAAETTLFEIVFAIGPLLVAAFLIVSGPAAAILGAGVITLLGTLTVARGTAMRSWRRGPEHTHARGLGPLKVPGFPALLVCIGGLGVAFGAAGVTIPAYATTYVGAEGDTVGGILLAIWAVGSTIGGFWFGTRRPAMPLAKQFAWLLSGVSTSFLVYAVTPHPGALAVILLVGGATIAPALTVETSMVAKVTPVGMLNEAYTWAFTMVVAASAVGGAVAGLIVDRPHGVPWAFVFAATAVAIAAAVAAWPAGPIARAATAPEPA